MRRAIVCVYLVACGTPGAHTDDAGIDPFIHVPSWMSFEAGVCALDEIDRPDRMVDWTSCGDGCAELAVAEEHLHALQAGEGPGLVVTSRVVEGVLEYSLVDPAGQVVRTWRSADTRCTIAAASVFQNAVSFTVASRSGSDVVEQLFVSYVHHGEWYSESGRRRSGLWSTGFRRFGTFVAPVIDESSDSNVDYIVGEHVWALRDGRVYSQWPGADAVEIGTSPLRPALLSTDTQVVVLAAPDRLMFWHPALEAAELLFEPGEGTITAVDFYQRLTWVTATDRGTAIWRDVDPSEPSLSYQPEFINPLRFEPGVVYESPDTIVDGAGGNPAIALAAGLIDDHTLLLVADTCGSDPEICPGSRTVAIPPVLSAPSLRSIVWGSPPLALLRTQDGVATLDLR